MMTSAGSQRNLASLIGVSHQRVGRWLTIGGTTPQGEPSRVKPPDDPAILAAINQAFAIHTEVSRDQAKHDRLPFDPQTPVYNVRLPFDDGRPGGRTLIDHTHWMTDALRNRVVKSTVKQKRYVGISVSSMVNMRKYLKQADERAKKFKPNRRQRHNRERMARAIREKIDLGHLFTPASSTAFHPDIVTGEINYNLRTRHEPATGEPGTTLASQILLQVDISKDKVMRDSYAARADDRRIAHNIARKTKRDKARTLSPRRKAKK